MLQKKKNNERYQSTKCYFEPQNEKFKTYIFIEYWVISKYLESKWNVLFVWINSLKSLYSNEIIWNTSSYTIITFLYSEI